jgi:hypothetical protein
VWASNHSYKWERRGDEVIFGFIFHCQRESRYTLRPQNVTGYGHVNYTLRVTQMPHLNSFYFSLMPSVQSLISIPKDITLYYTFSFTVWFVNGQWIWNDMEGRGHGPVWSTLHVCFLKI